MVRACQPELLDHLPADDAGAIQSRRDLRRLNFWMGNARYMARALNPCLFTERDNKILEIGAGDGSFFLQVAKQLSSGGKITLLDRQHLVKSAIHEGLEEHGWKVETVSKDVFEHLTEGRTGLTRQIRCEYDAIIANLFLHHFSEEELRRLFRLAAERAPVLIAIEPRRSLVSIFGGKLVWALGCNSVTRHDVMVSIRAGFTGHELSELCPKKAGWSCEERSAGLFSHLFVARNTSLSSCGGEGRGEEGCVTHV
jgi:hypothetical protein